MTSSLKTIYSILIFPILFALSLEAAADLNSEESQSSENSEIAEKLWPLPKPQWAQHDIQTSINKDVYTEEHQAPPYKGSSAVKTSEYLTAQSDGRKLRMYWNRDAPQFSRQEIKSVDYQEIKPEDTIKSSKIESSNSLESPQPSNINQETRGGDNSSLIALNNESFKREGYTLLTTSAETNSNNNVQIEKVTEIGGSLELVPTLKEQRNAIEITAQNVTEFSTNTEVDAAKRLIEDSRNESHPVVRADGLKIDLADFYGESRKTTWSPPGLRVGKRSKVLKVTVACDETSNEMKLKLLLDEGFNGIIYAEGHFEDPQCKIEGKGTEQELIFNLPLNGCGTLPKTNRDVSWYENNVALLFQQDEDLLTDLDRIYHLRCLFKEIPATEVSSHIVVEKNQPNVITGLTERKAKAQMKIVLGGDPTDQSLDTFGIGSRASMVVFLDENSGAGYNFFINQCYAHDGKKTKTIPLFDDWGCPEPNNVMGIQKRTTLSPLGQKSVYSHFVVFKFPDSDNVYFDCKVAICGYDCEMPKCNGDQESPNVTSSKIVKRDTGSQEFAQSGISVSINPDNINVLREERDEGAELKMVGAGFEALTNLPESVHMGLSSRFCINRVNMAIAICVMASMMASIVGLISYVCVKSSKSMEKCEENVNPNPQDLDVVGDGHFIGKVFKASKQPQEISQTIAAPQNEDQIVIGMNDLRMIPNRFIVGHHIEKSIRN